MKFILVSDLNNKIKENILDDILELSITGQTSGSTMLDEIEQIAMDEIATYVNQYYDVGQMFSQSGDTRDSYLIKIVIDIMLYELSCRLTPDNIPIIRQVRYDKAKEDLDKISRRLIVPNWGRRDSNLQQTSEILWSSELKNNTTW